MGCTNGHPLTAAALAALAIVASLVIGFVVGGGALDASRSRTAQVSDSQIGMLVGHWDRHRRDPVHWGWVAVASRAYISALGAAWPARAAQSPVPAAGELRRGRCLTRAGFRLVA